MAQVKEKTVRFIGRRPYLGRWLAVLANTTGREGSMIQEINFVEETMSGDHRPGVTITFIEATMSADDLHKLAPLAGQKSGFPRKGGGGVRTWSECIIIK